MVNPNYKSHVYPIELIMIGTRQKLALLLGWLYIRGHYKRYLLRSSFGLGKRDGGLHLGVRRFRESEWHGADSFTLFARSCLGVGVSFMPILLIGKLDSESHGVGSFSLFGRSCPGVGVSFLRNRLTSSCILLLLV